MTPNPPSGAPATEGVEERVLAFAEQLGRIAGTVQARTSGWIAGDALKKELARVRDGAADLLQQLTGDKAADAAKQPIGGAAPGRRQGRSGGVVDAPGKKHRQRMPVDPDANRAKSQAAKTRASKTMSKTTRLRGRG
jgi:hypothetical protein